MESDNSPDKQTPVDIRALLDSDPGLNLIVEVLQAKKGLDILVMDLRTVSDTTDFFVLCTGTSEPHVKSLSDDVIDRLRADGQRPWHVEGMNNLRWVLIDLVDIVVHIFRHEAREFYALERLWGDADAATIEDGWLLDGKIELADAPLLEGQRPHHDS